MGQPFSILPRLSVNSMDNMRGFLNAQFYILCQVSHAMLYNLSDTVSLHVNIYIHQSLTPFLYVCFSSAKDGSYPHKDCQFH